MIDDSPRPAASVIVTCSTFLTKPGKFEQFTRAMSSLLTQHGPGQLDVVTTFLIINEYDPERSQDFAVLVKAAFPMVEFIQKDLDQKGQARTLNLILERIAPFDFWIHWEESWECTRPFLMEALDVMQSSDVTQMQLTWDWRDVGDSRLLHRTSPSGSAYLEVMPHPDIEYFTEKYSALASPRFSYNEFWGIANADGWSNMWPLYSLRPSINRVAFYAGMEGFPEAPYLWPVRFEWSFAVGWIRRGGVKAVLEPAAASRLPGHVSTYL